MLSAINGARDFKQELRDSFPTSYFAFPASALLSFQHSHLLRAVQCMGCLQHTWFAEAPSEHHPVPSAERVNQNCNTRKTFCLIRLVCSRKRRLMWVKAVCLLMWESWYQHSPGLELQTHTDSVEHCPHSHEKLFCLTLP